MEITLEKNSRHLTVFSIVKRLIIVIALVEFVVLSFFALIQLDINHFTEAVLDAILLSLLSAPFLYYWVILPFIKDRDKAEASIRHLALHDPLTGLANRRLLEEHAVKTLSVCSRDKSYSALLLLDLDGFKAINDTHGHEAGDLILQNVSESLIASLRQVDLASRLGGDEFVVLLNQIGSDENKAIESTSIVANKLLKKITHPVDFSGEALTVGASIGLRIITPKDNNVEILLRDADEAMYLSKKAGRGCITLFESKH